MANKYPKESIGRNRSDIGRKGPHCSDHPSYYRTSPHREDAASRGPKEYSSKNPYWPLSGKILRLIRKQDMEPKRRVRG